MIKLQQLNTFLEISRAGSIRKAAEVMGLSQPALSRSLTLLEQELGVRLLERSVHGVAVTEAGRTLLSKARLIASPGPFGAIPCSWQIGAVKSIPLNPSLCIACTAMKSASRWRSRYERMASMHASWPEASKPVALLA